MANNVTNNNDNIKDAERTPLFTGNYLRDSSVSPYEKIAEGVQAIFDYIKKKKGKK